MTSQLSPFSSLNAQKKNQALKEKIYKENTGNNWDNRTRFQIYENKKEINNDIVIRFQPSYFLSKQNLSIFPLSGISNSETIHCNENGYFSIYQSDRFGFNNPDEEWNNKEIEYLLVGDSFTHGSCVNRPKDIASVLRTLSSKSALNNTSILGKFMSRGQNYWERSPGLHSKILKIMIVDAHN